jgi:hypothetical protein
VHRESFENSHIIVNKNQIFTMAILMHQMRISTMYVSPVMITPNTKLKKMKCCDCKHPEKPK